MMIKPFHYISDVKTESKMKCNSLLDRRRIAVSPSGRARIEEIHIDPDEKTVTKICSLGDFEDYRYSIGNRIRLDSSLKIVTDLTSGETLDYNIKSQIPNNNRCKTFQTVCNSSYFTGDDESVYILKDTDKVYPSKYVDEFIHKSSFDPEYICLGINTIEESVQMPYIEFIGLLDSFFTQWGLGYPFDSKVIIDTKTKEFTPRFTYCKELLDEKTALAIYATYAKEISKLIDIISRVSEIENRHFRIKVYTNAYMSYMSITDMDYKEMSFDIKSSNCDHFRSLVNNKIASSNYDFTESAGLVVLNKRFGNITSDILETIQYVDSFSPF